jgi:hypothetical protein
MADNDKRPQKGIENTCGNLWDWQEEPNSSVGRKSIAAIAYIAKMQIERGIFQKDVSGDRDE